MFELAARSIIDQAFYRERQRTTPHPLTFDTTSLPIKLKLPARLFRPGELQPIITTHVTDVRGGFGLAKYQIAAARKLIEMGKVPAELALQLPLDIDDASYMLALLIRYSGDAYHDIVSRRVGQVINHPFTLRTSASNGGNMGVAWAVDAANDEQLSPELVTTGIASLTAMVRRLHERTGKVVVIVPHRVWSDQRLQDPGVIVWRAIVLPVVQALGPELVVIGYNTRGGSGRYISNDWDPHALYDSKGRQVAPTAAEARALADRLLR